MGCVERLTRFESKRRNWLLKSTGYLDVANTAIKSSKAPTGRPWEQCLTVSLTRSSLNQHIITTTIKVVVVTRVETFLAIRTAKLTTLFPNT